MARVSTTSDIRLTVQIAEELRAFAERQEQLALLVAGNLRLPPQLRRDGELKAACYRLAMRDAEFIKERGERELAQLAGEAP